MKFFRRRNTSLFEDRRAWRRIGIALACMSTLLILAVTLYPYSFPGELSLAEFRARLSLADEAGWLEPLANIGLFVPLGIGLALLIRSWTGSWLVAFVFVQVLTIGLTVGIEIVQVTLPGRHPSAKDMLMNSIGGLLGFLLVRGSVAIHERAVRRFVVELLSGYTVLMLLVCVAFARTDYLWSPGNWDDEYPLLVGNEFTGTRPWRGSLEHVFVLDRRIDDAEAKRYQVDSSFISNYESLLFYLDAITSRGNPESRDAVRTVTMSNGDYYMIRNVGWVAPVQVAAELQRRVASNGAFTIGFIATPRERPQDGPARIISLSRSEQRRNLTFGQEERDLVVRVRTPLTGWNGNLIEFLIPDAIPPGESSQVIISYSSSGIEAWLGPSRHVQARFTPPATITAIAARLFGRKQWVVAEEDPGHAGGFYLMMFVPFGLLCVLILNTKNRWNALGLRAILIVLLSVIVQALFAWGAPQVFHFQGVLFGAMVGIAVVVLLSLAKQLISNHGSPADTRT